MKIETRQQFINSMFWMVTEVNKSTKGNVYDIASMMEFQLQQRESELLEVAKKKTSLLMKDLRSGQHSNKYIEIKVIEMIGSMIVQKIEK